MNLLFLFPSLLSATAAGAPLRAARQESSAGSYQVRIARIGPEAGIRIDGELGERAWEKAALLGPLTQVDPVEGAKPTRRTQVRLAYDRERFYLAIECFDEPSSVHDRLMARDANLDPDDRVEWWIDTFHDRRFAYWFQIGAGGSKGDALIALNGRSFNKDWDAIWYGKAKRTPRGWQAEVAIPFSSLAFAEGGGVWGFNLRRLRKANDEEDRWANPRVAYFFFRLAEGGEIHGLKGLRQGLGLDITPFLKFAGRNLREDRRARIGTAEAGGDLRFRISPSMSAVLTWNTDFAETEVDARRLNLTRFPLFFPEKRDFFLEDAGLFEFGAPDLRRNLLPFFSRRIGRDASGRAIPLYGGLKVTGRSGPWNLGFLGTLNKEHGGFPSRGQGVLRLSRNLGRESSAGVIVTEGRPEAPGRARTVGADLSLNDSRAFGRDRSLRFDAWFLASSGKGEEGGQAFGLGSEFRTRDWVHRASMRVVDDDFDPALGFVRREGIVRWRWQSRYAWRSEGAFLRRLTFRLAPTLTTDLGHDRDSWSVPLRWLGLEFDSGDTIEIESHRIFERLPEDFEIRDGVVVPEGDYSMTRHFLTLELSDRRALSGEIRLEAGRIYDGSISQVSVAPLWIPNPRIKLGGLYEETRVRLNHGDFTDRVASFSFDFQGSPDLVLRNLLQYDTESRELGLQSRLRWILEPGKELFLVLLAGWRRPEGRRVLQPLDTEVVMKFFMTFRF